MKLNKTARLIWTFYRSFVLASVVITICCIKLLWDYDFMIFGLLFWFKVATLGLVFYFINSYKSNHYYYYQNLGVSRAVLWATTLGFDLFLFIFLTVLAYKIR
ncbi:hypothetical protein [Pontibacter amylolyticus]|uniref:Uncharacterized protein n=1 Tax=Pontibacter amylolyticus TaxID=1424080 RepID=A0ABQ1WH97_9BACT|nr:hypothetical protein [Pontibacter amylolyticus]GGG29024.1 hypothetical protein GCM10011323_35540 [Pontibacter amylolyticus]